jgi:hypothetical protein
MHTIPAARTRADRVASHMKIFPGSKVKHFNVCGAVHVELLLLVMRGRWCMQQLRAETGVDFTEMVFFDDEHINIVEVGAAEDPRQRHTFSGTHHCFTTLPAWPTCTLARWHHAL